jgi:integrase/recombinase XerD
MDLIRQYEVWWKASGRSDLTIYTSARLLRNYERDVEPMPPTLASARAFVGQLRDDGMHSQTLLMRVRALKSFSKWYAEEFDEDDTLAKLRFPKVDVSPPGKVASDDDVDALLRPMKGRRDFRSRRDTALITLFRDSGIRRGEMARIRVQDVDMEQGLIILPRTKAYKARVIPLSRAARLAMSRYLLARQSHRSARLPALWLRTTRPCGLRADSITAVLDSRARDAGVNVTTHQFRRRFAAEWSRGGGSDDSLMAIAGWSSPVMPARYRQAVRQELALSAFDRIINGA